MRCRRSFKFLSRAAVTIARLSLSGRTVAVEIDESLAGSGFYNLAKTDASAARRALHCDARKPQGKVDAKAKTGKTPVLSRLLRFPPS